MTQKWIFSAYKAEDFIGDCFEIHVAEIWLKGELQDCYFSLKENKNC